MTKFTVKTETVHGIETLVIVDENGKKAHDGATYRFAKGFEKLAQETADMLNKKCA